LIFSSEVVMYMQVNVNDHCQPAGRAAQQFWRFDATEKRNLPQQRTSYTHVE